jgi:hypothetical protein
MWPEVGPADPYLFLAPLPGDIRFCLCEQRVMHVEDCLCRQVVRQGECCGHRSDVADDLLGVRPAAFAELGFRDGPGGRGEVLDLRTGGRLGAQQDGREGSDLAAQLSVEPGYLVRGVCGRR